MQEQRKTKAWINSRKKDIPNGIWTKCPECGEIIYNGELGRNLRICLKCEYYFPMDPKDRIGILIDEGTFYKYEEPKIADVSEFDNIIMTGEGLLSGYRIVIIIINLNFKKGINGLVISEKTINAINQAIDKKLPLLSVCTSFSEESMDDGILYPAFLVSISTAINRLDRNKLPYISVISQTSSESLFPGFVYAGDVIIGESNVFGESHTGSRIGRREAQRNIKILFEKSVVDMIVSRRELKESLSNILSLLSCT